ncbi:hypothetical protein QFZ56_007891 [Streptomyces achromogenes]|uniref:Transposase n=1 Tax=Streptomyces achromogenes TaxID=67255 RepID=A0ABU0QE38_STRAH|nr:hypothetical protein [Streptomyces achromogenes]
MRWGWTSLLAEVNKLQRVRWLQLPPELFGDVSGKLVAAWRARAAKEYPSDLRTAAAPVRYTRLSTLCHVRKTEITDSLVELFIQLVQKINTRAEKKVEGEFNKELKRVRGKEGILLRLAEAAVAEPGGTVRKVIYPVAGESTLKALAAEAAANEARYRARVRTVLRSSYSNHWRRMLSPLLNALELKCNNTAYRPGSRRTASSTAFHDVRPVSSAATIENGQPGIIWCLPSPRPNVWQKARSAQVLASGRSHGETSATSTIRPSAALGNGIEASARRSRATSIRPWLRPP